MTIDQDLRTRLAEVIGGGGNESAADAILDSPELLDDICEYRARKINATVDTITEVSRPPQHWDSVYDIPFGVRFWGCVSEGPVKVRQVWKRVTNHACHIPGAPVVEANQVLDARYPAGFSEVV